MKITPLEIRQQEFKKVMRGYDTIEVDTFLDMVGTEFEKLLHDNRDYEKRIIALEAELSNFKEVESTLKQTLMNVQETSDKSMANSKREAVLMRKEAELEAQQMIEAARRERDVMAEEVTMLNTQKQSLISRLRHVMTSQLELLDVLELNDADLGKLKDRTKRMFSAARRPEQALPKTTSVENTRPDIKDTQAPKADAQSDEAGSNLFKDVFGDDLETFVK
ncbi:MAG: DivIVA domain-containing protein [Calditrichales bacterium]|nr:MAG: DivIVA domain-containing protein [Calditrichales bacterium]